MIGRSCGSPAVFIFLWLLVASPLSHVSRRCVSVRCSMSDFASFGAFLTPTSSGAGKSGGSTGGGLFGVVPSGKGNVSLAILDTRAVGQAFCGGVVGSERKKMCTLAPGCGTLSHKTKMQPSDFPLAADSPSGVCAFIETQDGKAVYMASHVPVSYLGDVDYYRGQQRSVAQWEQFLEGLRSSGSAKLPSSAERSAFFDHVSESQGGTRAKTPFKKRRVFDVSDSPLSSRFEAEIEELKLLEVATNLDDKNAYEQLLQEWPLLVNNLSVLQGMVVSCKQTLLERDQSVSKDFQEFDFMIADLVNVLGRKPAEMAAGSVFDLLHSVDKRVRLATSLSLTLEQVDTLARARAILKGMDPNDRPLQEKLDTFSNSVSTAVAPLWALLLSLSSDQKAPSGDKLAPLASLLNHWPAQGIGGNADVYAWMQQAEARLTNLQQHQNAAASSMAGPAGNPPPPTTHQFGLGLPPVGFAANAAGASWTGLGLGQAGPNASFTGMAPSAPTTASTGGASAEIKLLQQQVADLQAQAASSSVVVAGQVFKSLAQVTSWMTLNASSAGSHVAFLDACGLLAVSYRDQMSSMEHAKFTAMTGKQGSFATVVEAKLDFSFQLELPQFFGLDSGAHALSASLRTLPHIKDYSIWNGVGGLGGARSTLSQLINNDMQHLKAGLDGSGSKEARSVSDEMMMESRDFLSQLSAWMTSYYLALTEKGHQEKSSWEVVCRAVRAIFKELYKVRMSGRDYRASGAPLGPAQVWACLQGLRMQREFCDAGFASHRAVINILHDYLMDTSVTKDAVTALETKLIALITSKVAEAKRKSG